MKQLLTYLALVVLLGNATAQFPYFQKFNYPAQLPTQVIYDMHSDSKGYLWLATDKGLYRFNGRNFTEIPFDKTSLKSLSYLQEDPQGNIWCMNFYKEVFCYRNDTLRQFKLKDQAAFSATTFLNIVVTSTDIWVASFQEIYQISKKNGSTVQSITPPQQGVSYLSNIGETIYAYGGNAWLFTYTPSKGGVWRRTGYQDLGDIRTISNGSSLFVSPIGMNRKSGFVINNNTSESLPPISLPPNTVVYHYATTGADEQWACTQSGGYLWDPRSGKTTLFFPDQSVTDIVKDYQGNYWVSTLDNGLFTCPSLENKLYKIHPAGNIDNITAIGAINPYKVITGSSKGLLAGFDVQANTIFKYNLPASREIEFITYDTTEKLIFTTRGIFKDGRPDPFEKYDYSKGVARDPFGNIIVSYFNGAFILNGKYGNVNDRMPDLSCELYKSYAKPFETRLGYKVLSLRNTRSNSVFASSDKKRFWVAYEDALYEYRYDGSFFVIKNPDNKPIVARTLYEMKGGDLIAGTSTDGVYIIRDGRVVKVFNKDNGLKSNNIKHCTYFNNSIWALTDESLELIDISSGNVSNLSDEYGLEQLQINDFAVNPDRFFLATTTGVLVNQFSERKQQRRISFPVLTVTANGEIVKNNSSVQSDENNFVFNIEALHFKSPVSLIYRYRMLGLDTAWKTTNHFTTSITYNRLTPGKYVFQIQAQDRSGHYKSELIVYSFHILAPFWLRWWFIILVLLVFFGAIYLFLQWWSKRLLSQQALNEQLFKSQLVALRSQMNPHFLYNVLNTVQGLLYDNRKTEAGTLLGNFSDLMRKTLKASDSQLQTLHEEMDNLRLYLELEKARFDKDFSYAISTNLKEDPASIYIPSLMLQPFVENAVKHGLMHKSGHKKLMISFEQTDDGIRVIIEDNGIGRKQSAIINTRNKSKPSSFATKAIAERIDLFNRLYKQKITYTILDKLDEHNQAAGTTITLIIPDYAKNDTGL